MAVINLGSSLYWWGPMPRGRMKFQVLIICTNKVKIMIPTQTERPFSAFIIIILIVIIIVREFINRNYLLVLSRTWWLQPYQPLRWASTPGKRPTWPLRSLATTSISVIGASQVSSHRFICKCIRNIVCWCEADLNYSYGNCMKPYV